MRQSQGKWPWNRRRCGGYLGNKESGNSSGMRNGGNALPAGARLVAVTLGEALPWNLAALLADKTPRVQPNPIMSPAGRLRRGLAARRRVPAEALDEYGAQAKEHCEEAGIQPREIHLRTPAASKSSRFNWPHGTALGNVHARRLAAHRRPVLTTSSRQHAREHKESLQEKSQVPRVLSLGGRMVRPIWCRFAHRMYE